MITLEDEYENGYTLYGNNDKVVISNQKVSKRVTLYHTEAYQKTIHPTGAFEFINCTDEELIELSNKVKNLPPHIEE